MGKDSTAGASIKSVPGRLRIAKAGVLEDSRQTRGEQAEGCRLLILEQSCETDGSVTRCLIGHGDVTPLLPPPGAGERFVSSLFPAV